MKESHQRSNGSPNDVKARKAVILARGLGTRMRRDDATPLDSAQHAAADAGMKAMMPVGRPFLDYVLSAVADAGYDDACLVVGPDHDRVRTYYTQVARPRRIRVTFAVQPDPRGTADAVLAAEDFVGDEDFLVINADNYYPAATLAALRDARPPALVGFDRDALTQGGNIPPERVASFAIVDVAPDGALRGIVEKPTASAIHSLGATALVSMNCWLFTPAIFDACRRVFPSPRGELELPHAVQLLVDDGSPRFTVITARAPMLDLSTRADVPAVAALLQDVVVDL